MNESSIDDGALAGWGSINESSMDGGCFGFALDGVGDA